MNVEREREAKLGLQPQVPGRLNGRLKVVAIRKLELERLNRLELTESPEAGAPGFGQRCPVRAAADPVRPRQLLRLRSPHDLDQLVRSGSERLLDQRRSLVLNREHDLAQLAVL